MIFYVVVSNQRWACRVKTKENFELQKSLHPDHTWTQHWTPINAASKEDAEAKAHELGIERYGK